ncbi:MAG TPA: PAS domain-containing protein [Elusimicrobiales bacterium]|nr:PAS domain-containing protein [Elusimicrobiales bacterium]
MLFDNMTTEMVKAMIETLPAELTVINAADEVAGWNKHETRLFKRPMTAMGMNFRQCHPEKSLAMVEKLIAEMKAGTRDKATFWIDLEVVKGEPKHKIFIEFYALRGEKGEYLGCMEFTQDVSAIRALEGQRRLMD